MLLAQPRARCCFKVDTTERSEKVLVRDPAQLKGETAELTMCLSASRQDVACIHQDISRCSLYFIRYYCVESALLHTRLLPRERDGLLSHTYVLLHAQLRYLPRPAAALWPHQGPFRDHATESHHRAGLPLHPGGDARGGGAAPELSGACGVPDVHREFIVEALAAALLLLSGPAL